MGDLETRVALLTQAVETLSNRVARGFDKVYHILHGKTGADGLVGTVRLAEKELESLKADVEALGGLESELALLVEDRDRRRYGVHWWWDFVKLAVAAVVGAAASALVAWGLF